MINRNNDIKIELCYNLKRILHKNKVFNIWKLINIKS